MIALLTGVCGMKLPKPIKILSIEFKKYTIVLEVDNKVKLIQILTFCNIEWHEMKEDWSKIEIHKNHLQADRALVIEA